MKKNVFFFITPVVIAILAMICNHIGFGFVMIILLLIPFVFEIAITFFEEKTKRKGIKETLGFVSLFTLICLILVGTSCAVFPVNLSIFTFSKFLLSVILFTVNIFLGVFLGKVYMSLFDFKKKTRLHNNTDATTSKKPVGFPTRLFLLNNMFLPKTLSLIRRG